MADQRDLIEFAKIKGAFASSGYEVAANDNDCRLGEGSFGKVYKVTCKSDKCTYAIKVMAIDGVKMEKYQIQELQFLMKMRLAGNPNVIKYFKNWIVDLGDAERLCIQMELCSLNLEVFIKCNEIGGPEIIQAEGSPRFYQQVFEQIINGLVFIHSIDWVHRDIHPGNILIANPTPRRISDINVKIADFGLARHIGIDLHRFEWEIRGSYQKLTPLKPPLWTPFAAPEIKKDTYDFKVDVYSAGVVLYFICRYPTVQRFEALKNEVEKIKEGKLDVKTHMHYKDDEKLCIVLKNLLHNNPRARPSAGAVKEYMFPKGDEPKTTEFLARKQGKKNANALIPCNLKKLTLSALREAVEDSTGVETDRQDLRHERKVNGEKEQIMIPCDDYVRKMFQKAAAERGDVVVVIRENLETGQMNSGDQPKSV